MISRLPNATAAFVVLSSTAAAAAVVVAGLAWIIDVSTGWLVDGPVWIRLMAAMLGLCAAGACLRWLGRGASSAAADAYLASAQTGTVDLRAGAGRVPALVATLAAGLPMGTEGPAVYIGSMVAGLMQRFVGRWQRHSATGQSLVVAGAAGAAAFIVSSWAAALVFVVEVPWRRGLDWQRLPAAALGGVVGSGVGVWLGSPPLLELHGPMSGWSVIGGAAVLGICGAVGARLVVMCMMSAKLAAGRLPLGRRIAAASILLAVMTIAAERFADAPVLVGTGELAREWATAGGVSAAAVLGVFLLRVPSTAVVMFGGGVGGIFVPLMVPGFLVGALLHQWSADWFPLSFVAVGGLATIAAGYGVPLMSAIWLVSLRPSPPGLLAGLIAIGIAWWPNRSFPATMAKVSLPVGKT